MSCLSMAFKPPSHTAHSVPVVPHPPTTTITFSILRTTHVSCHRRKHLCLILPFRRMGLAHSPHRQLIARAAAGLVAPTGGRRPNYNSSADCDVTAAGNRRRPDQAHTDSLSGLALVPRRIKIFRMQILKVVCQLSWTIWS